MPAPASVRMCFNINLVARGVYVTNICSFGLCQIGNILHLLSSVDSCQGFGRTCCLSVCAGCKNKRRRSSGHLLFVSAPSLLIRRTFIRNVGACVPNNTASALKTVMFVVSNLAVLPHYESLSANAVRYCRQDV